MYVYSNFFTIFFSDPLSDPFEINGNSNEGEQRDEQHEHLRCDDNQESSTVQIHVAKNNEIFIFLMLIQMINKIHVCITATLFIIFQVSEVASGTANSRFQGSDTDTFKKV